MRLAFFNSKKYADYSGGYALYAKRGRGRKLVDEKMYGRVVREYCKALADRLCTDGSVTLPNGMGVISSAILTRRPQYRGDKFIGYGKFDYKKKEYDGTLKTFGIVFLPSHDCPNLRCFGYVANKRLFRKMKSMWISGDAEWVPVIFNDSLI